MSTESSTNPADVSGDVSTDGPGGQTNQPRRSRRARRRHRGQDNRRFGDPKAEHRNGTERSANSKNDDHRRRSPTPADVAKATGRSRRAEAGGPGSSDRPGSNGRAGGSGRAGAPDRNGHPSIEGARTRVTPPKPSDLAGAAAKIAKTGVPQGGAGNPAANKNRRRGRNERTTDGLQTVRETSAGGLVISDLDLPVDELCAALIGRMDRRGRLMWSLPKGHIETGETAEQTAIREVAEETGIRGTVVAPLGKIDYWFVSEGRRIHKTVHHYLLRSVGGELSDADYEVSEVAWVPLHELPRRLTYSDERRLAKMARSVIADLAADPQRLAQSEAESSRTEPNAYEKAAAARNQRRTEYQPRPDAPPRPAAPRQNEAPRHSEVTARHGEAPAAGRSRRRRRRPRRPAAGDA
ncbi:MAG: NUDIX hydrolase [Gordonia sp. (in: high G+C Gram-positive bacteria)]